MQGSPFQSQGEHALWQQTANDGQRANLNESFGTILAHMKMWRRMIGLVHLDDDTKEAGDFGHDASPRERDDTMPPVRNFIVIISLLAGAA